MTGAINSVGIRRKGRPPGVRHSLVHDLGSTRNNADSHTAVGMYMEPSLRDELLHAAGHGKTTMTVLAAVARYPHARQREAYEKLNAMGARAAKRWVENTLCPPSSGAVALSILAFLKREFPAVDLETLQAATLDVADSLGDLR